MSNHATNWDKVNNESKIAHESLTAELKRYKERVKILEQRFNVDLSIREKFTDSQMDDMIWMKNTKFAAFETEINTLKQTLSKHVKEKESFLTTLNGFKKEFKERESKSITKRDCLENKNKELENIVFAMQLTQEIFQKDKSCANQNALEIQEYFEQNDLQAQLHAKDTVINNLKETIHSLRENVNPAKVKKDIDEIECHTPLKRKHECWKTFLDPRFKCKNKRNSSLGARTTQVVLHQDLKAQIQKVFANASLKNELRKLKGKNVIDTVVSKPNATTITPGMFKLDIEPISHRLKNNRDAHEDYLKKTT
ncbi:hypothetical protein Tco_1058549 [Tanacetum coccineum]|uniref:Uncharacterized protein n=1 Tax=Tanacetum coccineum TaxID=301880 RepID=A0ABQ5HAC6_9ASTR